MKYLLIAACIPSIVLLVYVYKKDKHDKEPFWLLALLFGLGAAVCFPAAFLERILNERVISAVLSQNSLLYQIVYNYLDIALVEESLKFLVLFLVTRKSKHFNGLFDGIIYAVVVSLGFATLENILYVFQYGWGTALLRAVTAVPGHMFDGVIMGQLYTMWHISKQISTHEKYFASIGLIDRIINPERKYTEYIVSALAVPILVHGTYDFLATLSGYAVVNIIFIVFLIALYIYSFKKINRFSRNDTDTYAYTISVLEKKYPYLRQRVTVWNLQNQNAAVTTR